MPPTAQPPPRDPVESRRITFALVGSTALFFALATAFVMDLWGRPEMPARVPLVDTKFLDQTASRRSYADLVRAKEDLSDFDCYVCHEKDKPPPVKLDATGKVIIPEEHENIVMAHGSHNRNNLCYNCHNDQNLETLHVRAGPDLRWDQSTQLCGSCHGPTLRDWEAGVHGRTSGNWDRRNGQSFHRLDCVNCHNPHQPGIPGREPAPGPNLLRPGKPAAH